MILADFQRVKIRQLHWFIGLQEIGLTLPLQHFSAGIFSRIEPERNRIRDGCRFGDLLNIGAILVIDPDRQSHDEHYQEETPRQPICPFSARQSFTRVLVHLPANVFASMSTWVDTASIALATA